MDRAGVAVARQHPRLANAQQVDEIALAYRKQQRLEVDTFGLRNPFLGLALEIECSLDDDLGQAAERLGELERDLRSVGLRRRSAERFCNVDGRHGDSTKLGGKGLRTAGRRLDNSGAGLMHSNASVIGQICRASMRPLEASGEQGEIMAAGKKSDVPEAPVLRSGSRRATSYDVARAVGVSQSAVSRCFAPGASIAPATRKRIMKAAEELGYRPNALAQGLISGRTKLVAVIISSLTNLSYPEVLVELCRRLTERDIRVLLFSLNAESEVDGVLEQVWRHSVDGTISAARLSEAQVQLFANHDVPLVLYNRTSKSSYAASVACDSMAGERDLVEQLLAAGHKRFAIIAGPDDSAVGEERRIAALDCLAEAGIRDVAVKRGDFSYESGREAFHDLIEGASDLEAVICVSDLMAIGAIDAARNELGIKIPDALSIVGFDGSIPATWISYQVTTIRQPVRRMAQAAVTMLMERVENGPLPAERRLFAGELLRGRSARLAQVGMHTSDRKA
ncbi:MAG: LacI family DNA-binding transcriptional regulator [Janthinobacterium lividum]